MPLMSDFYHILKSQTETEAQELALCLEFFVEGSLNIFNHHTNVDEDNRLAGEGSITLTGDESLGELKNKIWDFTKSEIRGI